MRKWILISVASVLALTLIIAVVSYNGLVTLDQGVKSGWAEVENTYQRRADLVPNLVSTVKGAAAFERETLTAVTEARARVGQVSQTAAGVAPTDPAALAQYQTAQDALSTSLSRLMVVVERYPELHATQNFRDLQSQLEGTENRITVARMRFNEASRAFNSRRSRFPAVVIAGVMGARFDEKPYFASAPGADVVPTVDFGAR